MSLRGSVPGIPASVIVREAPCRRCRRHEVHPPSRPPRSPLHRKLHWRRFDLEPVTWRADALTRLTRSRQQKQATTFKEKKRKTKQTTIDGLRRLAGLLARIESNAALAPVLANSLSINHLPGSAAPGFRRQGSPSGSCLAGLGKMGNWQLHCLVFHSPPASDLTQGAADSTAPLTALLFQHVSLAPVLSGGLSYTVKHPDSRLPSRPERLSPAC